MFKAPEATARALDAASDLSELLRLAHGAIQRAQAESHGEAYDVACRLSRQMHYMRKVAELLRHEIERFDEPEIRVRAPALPLQGRP
jgi:hypothetical protein